MVQLSPVLLNGIHGDVFTDVLSRFHWTRGVTEVGKVTLEYMIDKGTIFTDARGQKLN